MIDLETMGTSNDAAITAIGAVFFDSAGLHNEFYCTVDLADAAKYGRLDASTVKWWLQQDADARREIYLASTPLGDALFRFSQFVGPDATGVWGFGATFDNVILRSAYKAVDLPCPWHFRNDRCFRTLAAVNRHIEWAPRVGTHHNALDDAKTQALTAIKMLWPSLPQNNNPQC
jgi:exodeoxyribonuclease VIII